MNPKSSIKLASASIALVTIVSVLGFVCNWAELFTLPNLSPHRKFMMPGKYKVHLNKDTYTIWYYPHWEKVDQKHFPPVYKYLHKDLPQPIISISSVAGVKVRNQEYSDRICGGGAIFKQRIGKFEIHKSGDYMIQSSMKNDAGNYVIAVVPSLCHDPNGTYSGLGGSYFSGSEEPILFEFQ